MNDYIYLNGKLFRFATRKPTRSIIGSSITRMLSGKATRDIIAIKNKWTFSFENLDNRELLRLSNIFSLKSQFTLIDYDNISYTVLWDNDFNPESIDIDCYTLSINLVEV